MQMGDCNLNVFEHTRGTHIEVGGLQVAHHCSKLFCYKAVLVGLNSLTVHMIFCFLFDVMLFLSADTVESSTIERSSKGNRNIHEFKLPV
jgi:hypothetical protein